MPRSVATGGERTITVCRTRDHPGGLSRVVLSGPTERESAKSLILRTTPKNSRAGVPKWRGWKELLDDFLNGRTYTPPPCPKS
jgi:hypothetical protein